MRAIQGVYKITNRLNNKIYIGRSTDIHKRWKQHIKELLLGTHHCQSLQFDVDIARMDEVFFDINDILRFEIIEKIHDKSFKYRELEEIQKIPKDLKYNMPDIKDEVLFYLGLWCRKHHINFEIDYQNNTCRNQLPLTWNMRIDLGDKVILIVLRMEIDDEKMLEKYRNTDEIRDKWVNEQGCRWILYTYRLSDDIKDIVNTVIERIKTIR